MDKQIADLLLQIEFAALDAERVRKLRQKLAEARRCLAEKRHRKVAKRRGETVIRSWRSERD